MKLKVEIDKKSREMDKNRLGEKVTIQVPLNVGQTSEVGRIVPQHHYRVAQTLQLS